MSELACRYTGLPEGVASLIGRDQAVAKTLMRVISQGSPLKLFLAVVKLVETGPNTHTGTLLTWKLLRRCPGSQANLN